MGENGLQLMLQELVKYEQLKEDLRKLVKEVDNGLPFDEFTGWFDRLQKLVEDKNGGE